jgi:hypothetical protein
MAKSVRTMKDMDAVSNEYFRSSGAATALESQLDFFWHLTSRVGMSISESDLDEIKQAHERAAAAVDAAFESMLEIAIERRQNLSRYSDISFVSVGEGCMSRAVLTRWGMKPPRKLGERSGPFDLSIHPVSATITLLQGDFAGWIDPDRLRYSEEDGYVVNPGLGVSFNHETGEEYNQPGSFEKVRAIYERRLENFRRVLSESPTICFVLHIIDPSREVWKEVRELWDLLCAGSPRADHLMVVLNTWQAGQEIDTAGREPIAGQDIRVVDIHYPFPGYRWWLDFTSEAGREFERELIAKGRAVVDAWRGLSSPG